MASAPTGMLEGFRPGWPLTVLTAAGLTVLLGLGTWQIQRLQWKTALIAEIEAGLDAPPLLLDGGGNPKAYQPVLLTGSIDAGNVLFQGSYARKNLPGTLLLQVFESRDGRHWLLERGWIPEDAIGAARKGVFAISGEQEIEAVARPPKARGPFTPEDNLQTGRLYAEDIETLAGFLGLPLEPLVLVQKSSLPSPQGWDGLPQLNPPRADLPNNHLGYVVTWYGLAAALLGVFLAFGRARAQEKNS